MQPAEPTSSSKFTDRLQAVSAIIRRASLSLNIKSSCPKIHSTQQKFKITKFSKFAGAFTTREQTALNIGCRVLKLTVRWWTADHCRNSPAPITRVKRKTGQKWAALTCSTVDRLTHWSGSRPTKIGWSAVETTELGYELLNAMN